MKLIKLTQPAFRIMTLQQQFLTKNYLFSSNAKNITNDSDLIKMSLIENNTIGVLQLNDPKKKHALSLNMLTSIYSSLEKFEKQFKADKTPQVIILKSSGNVFCSGHDLKEIQKNTKEQNQKLFKLCGELMVKLTQMPQPIIASVNGLATAAGLQLVLSCDLVVASNTSKFQCPGPFVGLFCTTPGVALARAMPSQKKTLEKLLTALPMSAEESQQYGMINQVVKLQKEEKNAHDVVDQEAIKLAKTITVHSPVVTALGKKAYYQQIKIQNLQEAYDFGGNVMAENLELDDAKIGVEAFINKKKPIWKK